MKAEIITIGDEILIGQIIDTNSAWLAEKLNEIGIEVWQMSSISDSRKHILDTLKRSTEESDIVLITGGLGPTSDDITKPVLAEFFETDLVSEPSVLQHIQELMKKRGGSMNELNIRQAEVPRACRIVPNEIGTAPGMWFEKNGKVFISMPGVPFEMKHMTENYVLPMLKAAFELPYIKHHTIQTFGFAESTLAEMLTQWESDLPNSVKLAYLPSPERLRLRLTIIGENRKSAENIAQKETEKLKKVLGNAVFASGDIYLEQKIGEILKVKNKTISTAESCTGGNIARLITSIAGSSEYFSGSVVAYSNQIKESILGVNPETLRNFGAVSKETAEEMALCVMRLLKTDYAISVTGIAGPAGGSEQKPVGTVWIAAASEKNVVSKMFRFGNNRDINIRRASSSALNFFRLALLNSDI